MSENADKKKVINRRSFLMGGAAATLAGIGVLTGCSAQSNAAPAPAAETWDGEADVVVVGFGAAGGAATAQAISKGLSVLVVESTAVPGGTARTSGGIFWIPCNSVMGDEGFSDTPEAARTLMLKGNQGIAEEELIDTVINEGPKMVDFLRGELKLTLKVSYMLPEYHSDWPGGMPYGRSLIVDYKGKKAAEGLMAALYEYSSTNGAKFVFNCHADKLVQDSAGKVIGLEALNQEQNRQIRIKANYGVVLATGGFEWNEKLRKAYLPGPIKMAWSLPPGDGSGLLMAQGIGAELANMGDTWANVCHLSEGWETEVATYQQNIKKYKNTNWSKIIISPFKGKPGSIVVNKYGKRFYNEATDYDAEAYPFFEKETFGDFGWRNLPAYYIKDAACAEKYGLGSFDNSDTSYWKSANTLEELANVLGIDPASLKETVERFNKYAAEGKDPDFHRGESFFDRVVSGDPAISAKDNNDPFATLGPIGQGPYYAAELFPSMLGTCGGPRVNGRAQVFHASGHIIEGLYAAGNCAGVGAPGPVYIGPGNTVGNALIFGYAAATHIADVKNAATEKV